MIFNGHWNLLFYIGGKYKPNRFKIKRTKSPSSMKYLTLTETRKIMVKDIGGNEFLRIKEDSIKDSKWGSLFNLELAK